MVQPESNIIHSMVHYTLNQLNFKYTYIIMPRLKFQFKNIFLLCFLALFLKHLTFLRCNQICYGIRAVHSRMEVYSVHLILGRYIILTKHITPPVKLMYYFCCCYWQKAIFKSIQQQRTHIHNRKLVMVG